MRHRPLADVRIDLRGADDPESAGVLVAQTRSDVDGGFYLRHVLAEDEPYAYYNLLLSHPQVEVTDVLPGAGGEERAPTWIGFPPPHEQASLDNAWYVAERPPRLAADLIEPVPVIKGEPTFALIQPIDFKLDGIELTQAIQCFDTSEGDASCPDNSLPLVAGKLTAARVYISRVGPPPAEPQYPAVRVDLFVTATVPGAPVPVVSAASQLYKVRLEWDRGDETTTANFLISAPPAGPLYAWAQVNADNKWPDPNPSNNVAATVAAVTTTRAAKIRWVRVNYKPDPTIKYPTYPFKGPNLASESWIMQHSLDVARVVYPTATIDYQKDGVGVVDYSIEVPTDTSFNTWKRITPDIRDDFVVNGATHRAMSSYLNNELVVKVPSQRDYDTLLAWFPPGATDGPNVIDGIAEGAPPIVSNGSGRACLGPEPKAKVGAHEIAHNYGLGHFPCFLNPSLPHPWPAPYNDCSPVEVPFDPFLMKVENSFTFMTYGGDSISPVEWKFLLAKLQSGGGASAQRVAPEAPALLIRGWLSTAGEGGFYPLYTMPAAPSVPDASAQAPAEIRFLDASGQVIAHYPFDLQLELPEGGPADLGGFQWWLPRPDGLDRVQLLYAGILAHERQASAHQPEAEWLSPSAGASLAGPTTLTWLAADGDDDPLFFMVSYSHDGGTTWVPLATDLTDPSFVLDADQLPGGDECLVRVLVSDLWHTREVVGGPFRIGRKPPEVAIGAPPDEAQLDEAQTQVFTAWAADREDGAFLGDALRWSSDRDGALGTGAILVVPAGRLSPGTHRISLAARDADDVERVASVSITVRRTVSCVGDCALDGRVTIDELIALVRIALGTVEVFDCEVGDADGDGAITIDELVTAVRRALEGCPL